MSWDASWEGVEMAVEVGPVSRSCRINWLLLCRGVKPPHNECPVYDSKQSDDETPVMLEL